MVPKIPSYTVRKLAEAIGTTCKKKLVGIRPGEKEKRGQRPGLGRGSKLRHRGRRSDARRVKARAREEKGLPGRKKWPRLPPQRSARGELQKRSESGGQPSGRRSGTRRKS